MMKEIRNVIFHIDVNSAFLSWSAVKRLKEDPASVDLRTIPSAVGGDVETRHGVITARSIPAKKYGVITGEPVVKALQKCPHLVMIPGDYKTYKEYSRAFISILHEYTDQVEQVSVDEAYVDVTELVVRGGMSPEMVEEAAKEVAASIREEIRIRLFFTVNVGISDNKLLAKMASDFKKPDLTHTLWPEEMKEKMWPLDIGELYGCGKKTAERMRGLGIRTIGEAAMADPEFLRSIFGEKRGNYIKAAANGIGSSRVHTRQEEAKSYSNESTTSEDYTNDNYERLAFPLVRTLSESISRRMKKDGVFGLTVTVGIKTNDFKRHTRQMRILGSTNEADIIYEHACKLLMGLLGDPGGVFDQGKGIRLISVGMSTLDHGEYRQLDLLSYLKGQSEKEQESATREQERKHREAEEKRLKEKQERRKKLDAMLQSITQRYGDAAVRTGNDLMKEERKT